MILLSFVIGYAAERSRSVIVAVSLHMYIDVLLSNLDLLRFSIVGGPANLGVVAADLAEGRPSSMSVTGILRQLR